MQDSNVKIQTVAVPIIAIMVVTLFFYYAEPILVPVVIGITLAFILNPAVKLLRRARLPHVVAVLVVVFFALIIFLSLAALIAAQTGELVAKLRATGPDSRYSLRICWKDSHRWRSIYPALFRVNLRAFWKM